MSFNPTIDCSKTDRTLLKFLKETEILDIDPKKTVPKSKWPDYWFTVYKKTYPRMTQISLPKPALPSDVSLKSVLTRRSSKRTKSKPSLSKDSLSNILHFSAGINNPGAKDFNETKRFYPSAGARYPLEVYVYSDNTEGLAKGLYHYRIDTTSLEQLELGNFNKQILSITGQAWTKNAKAVFFITAIHRRTSGKYGARAIRHIFLEAGHLCQNFYLTAEALGFSGCAIGGFCDAKAHSLLDLNPVDEFCLYIFTLL